LGEEIVILPKTATNFKFAEIFMQHGNKRLQKKKTLGRFPKINRRKIQSQTEREFRRSFPYKRSWAISELQLTSSISFLMLAREESINSRPGRCIAISRNAERTSNP
jgi:hypothetical protein